MKDDYQDPTVGILTDTEDWLKYWGTKTINTNQKEFFEDLDIEFPKNSKLLEIGGFPGRFAATFRKKFNCDVTILDFYIDRNVLNEVEKVKEIELNSIKYIEADLMTVELKEEYNIVCSFGFLEHFNDTKGIIERHLKALRAGGILFITIPNFRGISGIAQRIFHPENYEKHFTGCMNLKFLKSLMRELDMHQIRVEYFGIPAINFEKEVNLSRVTSYFIRFLRKIIAHLPFKKSRALAPFIYIYGLK